MTVSASAVPSVDKSHTHRGRLSFHITRAAIIGMAVSILLILLLADALDVAVGLGIVAATAVVIWLVGRSRPVGRGSLLMLLGLAGLTIGGGIGVWHLVRSGATATALAGLLALLAGLVLLVRGVADILLVVHGWWRLLAIPAAFLVFQFVLVPVTPTLAAVDPPRATLSVETPGTYGLPFSEVQFFTADATRLSGWYVPSRNGAALAVLHGSGSTRSAVLAQAAAVASRGYGVLLYDDRGHGRSEGTAMDFGWWGDEDLAAALTWLESQPGVERDRLGVVGISMGGEQALNLAATDTRIRVVVGEGVEPRQPADLVPEEGLHGWTVRTVQAISTATAALLSAAPVPMPLDEAVGRIAPRPVLLIAGAGEEAALRRAQKVAPATVSVWSLPGSQHAQGHTDQPEAWTSRVGDFLDAALSPGK